jgi:RNA polymerase sigma-70 factor (ECF subfamily)
MEPGVDQSEYEVIRRARYGNEDALGVLIDTHAGALIGYINQIVNDHFQAEDIAQETFIRAFDHLDKFDPHRPFRPWLFKIGRNLALNYLSSRTGRERIESVDISERWDIGTDAGPEEALEMRERKRDVEMVLNFLPAHFREVLHLRYMEGLEYDGIATALGLPIGTVKTWLFRAKKAFLTQAEASGLEFQGGE